jgi:high affinity sulfate transporter 1
MGYAEAAGLPPITGLYATVAPLLAYALFGPSPVLVLGPDSALAPLIAAAVVGPAAGDPKRAVALASTLALLTGAACLLAGLLRAGAVTELLSRPVRVGYANGIAVTVITTQLPKLFGFSVAGAHPLESALGFVAGVAGGRSAPVALAVGVACLVVMVVGRARAPSFPTVLVTMAGAALAVFALGLEGELKVVGAVPRGLPMPSLPWVTLHELGDLAGAAVGIALVSVADTSVLSRALAGRRRYRVDPNRELFGLAAANLAAGLFQGFPICSSSSRTPVAEGAGARSQVTGVVGALAIVGLLLAAPALLAPLPTAALAAVVLHAAVRLVDVDSLRVFARVRRADLVLSVATLVAVTLLGVLPGIVVAVGLSLSDFVRRAWRPHHAILGRAPGVKGYHDVTRYPDAERVPGLVMFRWDAPLFFANAEEFRDRVLSAVAAAPEPRWLLLAAEPITDVDTTAAEVLEELDAELGRRGVELAFAELKDPVRDRLARYGLQERVGDAFFFPTLGVAVATYLERTGVEWVDPAG